jgi:hypothetical protein
VRAKFAELMYPGNIKSPANSIPAHSSSSGWTHSTRNSSFVKLPSIELPSFDGTVSKWFHFLETFESLIIQNRTLPNVQKLHYLISSLKGEAKT